ncbi:hypothetical protein Tco_0478267 [Tanacetum coccineum]
MWTTFSSQLILSMILDRQSRTSMMTHESILSLGSRLLQWTDTLISAVLGQIRPPCCTVMVLVYGSVVALKGASLGLVILSVICHVSACASRVAENYQLLVSDGRPGVMAGFIVDVFWERILFNFRSSRIR